MTFLRRANPGRGRREACGLSRRPAAARSDGWCGGIPRAAAPLALAATLGLGCGDSEGTESARGAAVEAPPVSRASSSTPGDRGYEIRPLPPESLRLTGAAGSLAEMLETVERGLAERDADRLLALMITAREYETILYPALPAAHPPFGASFETLWVNHIGDARRGLRDVLERYGGREVRIHALRFEKPDQDFVNYVLHETSEVDVTVDGLPLLGVKLFGSVVRVGDQWKVLSYPEL